MQLTHYTYYPWQQTIWQQITSQWQQKRLPHALMFTGTDGLGQKDFAMLLTALCFCDDPTSNHLPCGKCRACHLLEIKNHPDLTLLGNDPELKSIKVDDIRQLSSVLVNTPHIAKQKVAIIDVAHKMNRAAANALLKTLEEPPGNTLLILITEYPARLPATIGSRCQRLNFMVSEAAESLAWLKTKAQARRTEEDLRLVLNYTQQAPLKALELLDSEFMATRKQVIQQLGEVKKDHSLVLKVQQEWSKMDIYLVMLTLTTIVNDLIQLSYSNGNIKLTNLDQQDFLSKCLTVCNTAVLMELMQQAKDIYGFHAKSSNLNMQLLLEKWLLTWSAT